MSNAHRNPVFLTRPFIVQSDGKLSRYGVHEVHGVPL